MPAAAIISVLNLLSGAVALLISYYAYRANRLIGSILLRYISVGFLLLGISLFMQAGTETVVSATAIDALKVRDVSLVVFLVYTALQLIAYAVFAWGYGLSFFSRSTSKGTTIPLALATTGTLAKKLLAAGVFILAVYDLSQAAIVVLLLLIVYQGVRVFQHTQSNLSLMVLFGFALIFVAHVLMLTAALTLGSNIFLVGNSIEFCGFVSLLFFLFWSGRVVK